MTFEIRPDRVNKDKRLFWISIFVLIAYSLAFSLDGYDASFLKRVGLSEEEFVRNESREQILIALDSLEGEDLYRLNDLMSF